MPIYIDGRVPIAVTTLEASVTVQTPYIQQAGGAGALGVPAGPDDLVIASSIQTMYAKTIVTPTIQGPSVAQAWVKFTCTGSANIVNAYNVSSVQYTSTGVYLVCFSSGMTNTSYVMNGCCVQTGSGSIVSFGKDVVTTGTCEVQVCDVTSGASDPDFTTVTFFGD